MTYLDGHFSNLNISLVNNLSFFHHIITSRDSGIVFWRVGLLLGLFAPWVTFSANLIQSSCTS